VRLRSLSLNGLVRDRYGGRRALLCHLASAFQMRVGRFRVYQAIDWSRVERLVFVCKGNICRSAYAEARASSARFPAVSFGIEANCGAAADASAIIHAAARHVSLSAHRTSALETFAHRPGDLLVCMEPPQAKTVAERFADRAPQVTLLGLWTRPARPWLFDPYGSADGYWRTCLDTIDRGIDQMMTFLRQQHQGQGRQ
jgi:protein-tyrosine phosphatase